MEETKDLIPQLTTRTFLNPIPFICIRRCTFPLGSVRVHPITLLLIRSVTTHTYTDLNGQTHWTEMALLCLESGITGRLDFDVGNRSREKDAGVAGGAASEVHGADNARFAQRRKLLTMAAQYAQQAPVGTQQEAPQGPIFVDTQHDDMVHDAQLDYYGCKLATSSSGESILATTIQ